MNFTTYKCYAKIGINYSVEKNEKIIKTNRQILIFHEDEFIMSDCEYGTDGTLLSSEDGL